MDELSRVLVEEMCVPIEYVDDVIRPAYQKICARGLPKTEIELLRELACLVLQELVIDKLQK